MKLLYHKCICFTIKERQRQRDKTFDSGWPIPFYPSSSTVLDNPYTNPGAALTNPTHRPVLSLSHGQPAALSTGSCTQHTSRTIPGLFYGASCIGIDLRRWGWPKRERVFPVLHETFLHLLYYKLWNYCITRTKQHMKCQQRKQRHRSNAMIPQPFSA